MTEENPQKEETVEPVKKTPKTSKLMPHTERARASVIAKLKAKG